MELASAVKKLRVTVGLTQEKLGDLGEARGLSRLDVNAVENGEKSNSYKVRRGLAFAFGLTMDEFDAYVEGQLDLKDVLPLMRKVASKAPSRASAPDESVVQVKSTIAAVDVNKPPVKKKAK